MPAASRNLSPSGPGRLAELANEIGDVEILVNNAGFSIWGPTLDLGIDEFDALFAANVRRPYYLVAALAPGMSARGTAASSTSAAWPAPSAWPAGLPMALPRWRWER
jgi:NAD(P)-dependent dehydrogenase (short-subunit alcohol dehydrogenase family)